MLGCVLYHSTALLLTSMKTVLQDRCLWLTAETVLFAVVLLANVLWSSICERLDRNREHFFTNILLLLSYCERLLHLILVNKRLHPRRVFIRSWYQSTCGVRHTKYTFAIKMLFFVNFFVCVCVACLSATDRVRWRTMVTEILNRHGRRKNPS